ncbi:MAG: FG-GAP-like repeat-containing protein [Nitrospiria bacterium]
MNISKLQRFLLTLFLLISDFPAGCTPKGAEAPYLSLLPYPAITRHAVYSLRGLKSPGNGIVINDLYVVPRDNNSFWSGQVNLNEGNNPLLIKSINEYGNESSPIQINVTLNLTPPSSPVISTPMTQNSTWSTSIPIQGTKDSDSDILLNGKEIVSLTPATFWSYTYTPLQGTTALQFSSRNRLGNKSSAVLLTIGYNGPPPPFLVSPLDGENVKSVPGVFNSLLFSWTSSLGVSFQIQVSSTPDFSSPNIYNTQTNPYPLNFNSASLNSGINFWRVGAYDTSGNVFYSPSRKFFYGRITGDLNGDGYADIIVGAEGTKGPGQVSVFLGKPNPSNGGVSTPNLTPDLTLKGENGGDLFGSTLAVGDLNGDGYDDIIVGANQNGAGGNKAGRVYIYFGGPSLHATPDIILTGFTAGEQFGISVASGQDINRDGYDDLLVGANLNSLKGVSVGRAYLFLGGKTLSAYPDMVFEGEASEDHFGISVALAGDISGDGFSEILIGASGDESNSHTGKAYLYSGEMEPGNQPEMIFTGNSPGDGFGRMVHGVKDVNGDGYDDFIIGAPFHSGQNGEPQAGEAYLYFGGPDLSSNPDSQLRLPENTAVSKANFGFSASAIGDIPIVDINGFLKKDGFADFVVGAYGQITQIDSVSGTPITAAGKAHFFLGGSNPNIISNIYRSFSSGNSGTDEFFSVSIASPGDFNGDGFNDLIVGAMEADQATGRAYYYDGRSLSNPVLCSTCAIYGVSEQEAFGIAVE